jgi:hypothetical protein
MMKYLHLTWYNRIYYELGLHGQTGGICDV